MNLDAYLVGLLYGDGTIYKTKNRAYSVSIDQCERNKGILEQRAISILNRLGLKAYYYNYLHPDESNKWRMRVYSKDLFMLLEEVRKDSVKYANNLSDIEMKYFIAGLFDAEGTITDRLVLYNGNKELLELINKRLKSMGLQYSYIYRYGSVYGIQIYRKKSIKKFKELIPAWRLKTCSLG